MVPLIENQGAISREDQSKSFASSKRRSPYKVNRKVSTKAAHTKGNLAQRTSLTKVRLFTKIERKITTVTHEDYMKKSDVTLGDKKKLCIITFLNLAFYAGQIAIIFCFNLWGPGGDGNITNVKSIFNMNSQSPINLTLGFYIFKWANIFILQLLFAVLSLPCFKPG